MGPDTPPAAQIDDNASNMHAADNIMELHGFDGEDYQKWILTRLDDGYYSIVSEESRLALSVSESNLNSSDQALVQQSYADHDRQKWKISATTDGSYIIRPKSGESYTSDWCMSAGVGIGTNGRNVEQRAYTSDTDYKDEWYLYSIDSTVINLEVLYDQAYLSRFSSAPSRISDALAALQEKYLEEFGIWIRFTQPAIFASYADSECTTNHNTSCSHASDTSCYDSVLYEDGSIILHEYHHNNIFNNLYRIPFPDTSSSVKMAYIGHNTCSAVRDSNGTLIHQGNPVYGLTVSTIGLITITNFTSSSSEIKTTVHEFGHLFGVIDHYGNGELTTALISQLTGNAGYNSNCIYGENKDTAAVINQLIICDGCKSIIEANREKYDHN